MFDMKLDCLQDKHEAEDLSIESLLIDEYCSEEFDIDQTSQSLENCLLMLDLVKAHGIDNVVVRDLIGDQIAYTSQEELEQKLEEACEGLFGKIKDAIADKMDQSKDNAIDTAIAKLEVLDRELAAQTKRVGRDAIAWRNGIKVQDLEKVKQSINILDKIGSITEKTITSNHIKQLQTVSSFLSSDSTKKEVHEATKGDIKKSIANAKDIKKSYMKLKGQLSGFIGAVERLPTGFAAKNSEGGGFSKNDLMKYVTLGRKILVQIRQAIIGFVAGVHKSLDLGKQSDQHHKDQKKYFDGKF